MEEIVAIHTSDRISFKRCRRRWDLGSLLRQRWRPIEKPTPLAFGTSIHKALEVLYKPETWNWLWDDRAWILYENVVATFLADHDREKADYLKLMGRESLDEEQQAKYRELRTLGERMLRGYFKWHRDRDKDLRPIASELSFRVPILDEEGNTIYDSKGRALVYQGRIDLLVQDKWNEYWIWDHKTTARLEDAVAHLELDEQLGSYNWALQKQLKIKIAGNVYNELYKGFAEPPARNKVQRQGRWFSVNKQQDTSYELYKQTLLENDEPLEPYEDILRYLKVEGKTYFRRTQVHRSQAELREMEERIRNEALDMIDPNIRIYPNPNRFSCQWCHFRSVCLAMNDDTDHDWILHNNFTQEKDDYARGTTDPTEFGWLTDPASSGNASVHQPASVR